MRYTDLPEVFQRFFAPLDKSEGFSIALGRNIAYAKELAGRKEEFGSDVLKGLEILESGLPEEPHGSFAGMYLLQAASEIATVADIPLLLSMLRWKWVYEDHQYPLYILEAVKKHGCTDDIPAIEEFCLLMKEQGARGADDAKIPTWTREAKDACRARGPRSMGVCSVPLEIPECRGYAEK